MNAMLDKKVLIPDLLQAAPQARVVLDRYGLRGCGGPLGPHETLEFFAHAHDVPVDSLVHEIESTLQQKAPSDNFTTPSHLADAIYRPFFKAGIVVVLTLGAVWGAYLLIRIGWQGSFAAVGLHEVNAHGHAQIFGWVGLFVMGFAYQAFPRFKHTDLAWPVVAYASLWLMLAGLVGRSVAEPLAGSQVWIADVAVAFSLGEILAISLFVAVIGVTWKRSGKALAFYDYYIACAMGWFLVQAIYETVYLAATLTVTSRQELLDLVATWQGPLREIQIHGFALLMILGVSQRMFHNFYGLREPDPRLSLQVLVALNLAIVGEVVGLVLMRTVGHAFAMLWYGSTMVLIGAVVFLIRDWQIFSRPTESDRSLKFLRAAYVWLFLSLGMLGLMPVYQYRLLTWLGPETSAAQLGFSHAYYGAIRHAITVGFISLMIMGVSAKVVPTLNGLDVRVLSGLWWPFVLVNAGCALRVTGQTLTDFLPEAFPVAGVSGLLEVTGLALWGVHLWAIMVGRVGPGPVGSEAALALSRGDTIRPEHRVGDVLDAYPEVLLVFLSFGFKPLRSSFLRNTLAPRVTVARACQILGVDEATLLAALNQKRDRHPCSTLSPTERSESKRIALPIV